MKLTATISAKKVSGQIEKKYINGKIDKSRGGGGGSGTEIVDIASPDSVSRRRP